MNYKHTIRYGLNVVVAAASISAMAGAISAQAQNTAEKPAVLVKRGGRDPFRKYEAPVKISKSTTKLQAPPIQVRIENYRAQKMAAANAHVPPPKPTTALLLNEMQVVGINRTPRGWAAMVEATPIKLSYVIYPGETFFDGQLVAIEENRLVFRRDIVWADGRREKSVEIKPLRKPTPVEDMNSAKAAPASAPASEISKPAAPEKQ
jgi:hypothetical protein